MNYYTIDRQTEREREIIESLTTSSGKKYYGTRKEKRSVLYSFIVDVCLCASNGASLLFFFFSHRSLFVLLQYTHTHTSKTAYCPIFFSRACVVGLLFASWLFYSSLSFFPEHIHTYIHKEWFLLPLLLLCFISFFPSSFLSFFARERVLVHHHSILFIGSTVRKPKTDLLTIKQKKVFRNIILWIKVHYKNKLIHYDISYAWKKHRYQKHFKSKSFKPSLNNRRLRKVYLFIRFDFLYFFYFIPVRFVNIV
jgi:hypothetical protein